METLGLPRIHLLHQVYLEASEITCVYLCELSMQCGNYFAQEALFIPLGGCEEHFLAAETKIIINLTYLNCIEKVFLVKSNLCHIWPTDTVCNGHCRVFRTTLNALDISKLLPES